MLNEFKRPMWNDGYSKEQPWLNYFNSYERMHCCFGDDDGGDGSDDGGAGDEAAATSAEGTASAAADAAASEASYEDAMSGSTSYSGGLGGGAQAEGAASTGMDADQAQQVSDAIDAAAASGASVSQQQNIAEGGNRGAAGGYTGAELGQIAAANIDVNFFDETDKGPGALGVGAGFTSGRGSFADPNSMSGVGQTDFASYIDDLGSFAGWAGQNFGIGGAISAAARALDKDEKDVTKEDLDMSYGQYDPGATYGDISDAGIMANDVNIDPNEIDTTYGQYDPGFNTGSSDMSYGQYDPGFNTGSSDMSYGQSDPGANYRDSQSTSQGAYAQGVNTINTPFGPMTFDSRDAAMGFNNDYDIGGEDVGMVLPVLPTPEPEEEKEPRTAMEAYFDRMGIPSKPKTIPGRSFDFGIPPRPVNSGGDSSSNNNDIFSQEAARRRQMAMASPKYREPSGINSSIAIFAAANGMSYEEAALRFAPPNVPKEMDDVRPTLPVLTTFAASGGGLNSLMRYK
jgi:hypothetical protein